MLNQMNDICSELKKYTMIKSFLAAAVMLVSCLTANAQTERAVAPANKNASSQKRQMSPEERAVRVLRMMTSKTNLTEAQSAEVKQILLEREQVKASARNEDGTINKDKIADVKAASMKANEKLQAVLTPEQWKNWESYKEQVKERRAAKKAEQRKEQINSPEMEEDFY